MTVVGVTGHRHLVDPGSIRAGVDAALDWIEARFPPGRLTVLSALAEGADRLVAQRVLDRGGELAVALPLPIPAYLEDFPSPESKAEFHALVERAATMIELETAGTREQAYQAAGRNMVDRSDVLVAVWDGEEARGTGGTGEVVVLARARGLPIAWVYAGERLASATERPYGTVTFEDSRG